MVDYDQRLHQAYERGRRLAPDTLSLWMEAIKEHLPVTSRPRCILDIGSGVGRFTVPLAERFRAQVIGVEPSREMRRKVGTGRGAGSVSYLAGVGEWLPLADGCADAVFASMVLHHFGDLDQACREMARVLRKPGYVFIRNSFRNRLDSVRYYDFFPSARRIDNERLPDLEAVIQRFERAGLPLERHRVITQQIDASLAEYCERIRLRALSTFEFLSEQEFRDGIRAMELAAQSEDPPKPVLEKIDFLVFSKRQTDRTEPARIP